MTVREFIRWYLYRSKKLSLEEFTKRLFEAIKENDRTTT